MRKEADSKWFKCPAGTTAATVPNDQSVNTFCTEIAAGYYGGAGTSSAHATVTACPYGGTRAASTSNVALSTCTSPACGSGTNAAAHQGTCRCAANSWGTPLDANDAILATVTKGCTTCGTGYEATAGSTTVEACFTKTRPGTGGTSVPAGGTWVRPNDPGKWFKCPAGTTAAAVPQNQNANTFCGGIAAGYYGTKGTSSAHAVVTACPYGGTSSASPSTSTAVTACTPQCGSGTNAEANAGTCR